MVDSQRPAEARAARTTAVGAWCGEKTTNPRFYRRSKRDCMIVCGACGRQMRSIQPLGGLLATSDWCKKDACSERSIKAIGYEDSNGTHSYASFVCLARKHINCVVCSHSHVLRSRRLTQSRFHFVTAFYLTRASSTGLSLVIGILVTPQVR